MTLSARIAANGCSASDRLFSGKVQCKAQLHQSFAVAMNIGTGIQS
jgi:hypothetical protein